MGSKTREMGATGQHFLRARLRRAPGDFPIVSGSVGGVSGGQNLGILKQGRGKAKKRTLNWRYTTNGGTSYASAQSTPVASTVLTGLTPLTIVGVQVCITDSNGTSEWSQVVTLLVR